jgi:putative tryptophan/tyrosine transport system substrate-binding protein
VISWRTVLGVLALALLAAPLAAEAQAPQRVIRIGYLTPDPRPPDVATYYPTFRHALRALGWVEGQHYVVEYRFADGLARLPTRAAELVALPVDLIVVWSTPGALAAKAASTTVPIVFMVAADPVQRGLVASLARPGGNLTGFTGGLYDDKSLEVLKEAVPRMSRVGYLCECPSPESQQKYFSSADARRVGVQVRFVDLGGPTGLARALASTANSRVGGLVVANESWIGEVHYKQIAAFTRTYRLPAIGPFKIFAEAGGLLSYAPKTGEEQTRAAALVDKILKGANPADLPVERPTRFELVINGKTAKALGLTIPPSVLARADEVIQ